MVIDLSKINFVNDFFNADLSDGSVLVLNSINESVKSEEEIAQIKQINLQVVRLDGTILPCSSVIGIGNDILIIKTDYKEYEGKILSIDNKDYCMVDVYQAPDGTIP